MIAVDVVVGDVFVVVVDEDDLAVVIRVGAGAMRGDDPGRNVHWGCLVVAAFVVIIILCWCW